jgi:hypothetical protein
MTKARRSDRLKEKISNHSEVSETRCSTPLPDLLCSFCESVCTDSDCTNPDCPLVQYIARTPPEQSRPDSPASPIFECNCGHPRRMDLPCDNPECPDYVGDHNHFHNTEPSSIKPHQEDDDKDDEGDTASSNYIGPYLNTRTSRPVTPKSSEHSSHQTSTSADGEHDNLTASINSTDSEAD